MKNGRNWSPASIILNVNILSYLIVQLNCAVIHNNLYKDKGLKCRGVETFYGLKCLKIKGLKCRGVEVSDSPKDKRRTNTDQCLQWRRTRNVTRKRFIFLM